MINVRIKIGEGNIENVFNAHNLIYKDSDDITEAPIKKRYSTSYPEECGEHVDPRTVQDAFDYKVRFVIDTQDTDLQSVNSIVETFNKKLYTKENGSDIRTYKEITFYNDFKRVNVVGIPEPLAVPKEMFRTKNGHDYAEVELTIHVNNPSLCDFNAVNLGDYKVIACVGSAARIMGHYLCADTNKRLEHKHNVNEFMLWEVRETGQNGMASIYNVGAKAYLNGETTLSSEENAVCYIYDSPAVRNAVGFNSEPNRSTSSSYTFINARNNGNGVGLYALDAGSSFVIIPYNRGDTDEDLQAKVEAALSNG